MGIAIWGASPEYLKQIQSVISSLPPYIVSAANISRITVTNAPRQSHEYAQYEHGSRAMYLLPGLDQRLLRRALFHEIAHGFDDNFGVGHYFGESPQWAWLSRMNWPNQPTIETFAESMASYLIDPVAMREQMPAVARFMAESLAYLQPLFK